jgi:hypothetical protein
MKKIDISTLTGLEKLALATDCIDDLRKELLFDLLEQIGQIVTYDQAIIFLKNKSKQSA